MRMGVLGMIAAVASSAAVTVAAFGDLDKAQVQRNFDARLQVAEGPTERLAIGSEIAALGDARLAAGLPWFDEMWTDAAHVFSSVNREDLATQVLDRCAVLSPDPVRRGFCRMRMGQSALSGNPAQAITYFQQAISLLEAGEVRLLPLATRFEGAARLGLADALASTNNIEGAIQALDALLALPTVLNGMDSESRGRAFIDRARLAASRGDVERARSLFDQLWTADSKFGWSDGRVVFLKLEQCQPSDTLSTPEAAAAAIACFRRVLNDPAMSSLPESMVVSERLVQAHLDARERDKALEVALAARFSFRASRDRWTNTFGGDRFTRAQRAYVNVSISAISMLDWAKRGRESTPIARELIASGLLTAEQRDVVQWFQTPEPRP